jgi:hypothetical protein
VKGAVIDVGGDGIGALAEVFLLVANVVLCCSNNALRLDTDDAFIGCNALEEGVGSEAL